ncbi:MAG TPA: toprim domain-containing protein [Gaiellaceae bacterium]|nr:toprim domain-containing protein [Gaiellaceae bacterium]
MVASSRVSAVDYYTDVVLPELYERLDTAFPEFGWRRDARGWIATNNEFTHRALGVRAERVVAHAPVPRGFLVHGGDATLWTAYVAGGAVPRGDSFVQAVVEIARRAGVDTAPLERPAPRDRRTDLLHDFFTLCRWELAAEAGAPARVYLEQRGLPPEAVDRCGLGVVPSPRAARDCLRSSGYAEAEIEQSGVLADSRWSGRLCGGWRDERGRIKTLWARSLETETDVRYLYLRGASRTNLPPYGLSWVLKETPRPRDVVLVEGLLDVHQFRARQITNVVALGGTAVRSETFERFARTGFESITISLDRDEAGRAATAHAVERAAGAAASPAVYVVDPDRLAPAKDPDAFVRERAQDWPSVLESRTCGVVWRAREFARDIDSASPVTARRCALASAGAWLGLLPSRLSLEQEDAVRAVAEQCGYSPEAAARSFAARYWAPDRSRRPSHECARSM